MPVCLLIALGRFGGMRVPSEPLCLRWCDIDWTNQKIHFWQPKNEHHNGQETRSIPLFPELVQPLLDVQEQSGGSGPAFVITELRPRKMRTQAGNFDCASLTTRFKKIIEKAGLTPWPKPWINLRASRDTELRESFPSHVVDAWIGHCEDIAKRHYLMVTDDHFAKATTETVRKPVRSGTDSIRTDSHSQNSDFRKSAPDKEKRPDAKAYGRSRWTILDSNQTSEQPNTTTTYVDSISREPSNGAKTGAVGAGDARLDTIIAAWPELTEETRDLIEAFASGRCRS